MKRWSFSLGNYGGTEVRIHATFVLLLLFLAWHAALSGGAVAAMQTLALILAMFTCVLLHEFGHVLAARRYGIKTPDITLLPIGGLARLERRPREPKQELIVALAGPAVNVVIAFLLLLVRGFDFTSEGENTLVQGSFTGRLMFWNVIMVLFNMIPAFPMDGGRVLRAVLAMFFDYGKATRFAASLGQGFAVIGAVLGLMFFGNNPFLLIIAIFIFMSAGHEAAAVTDQEAIRGLQVHDALVTEFRSVRKDDVLLDAVRLLVSGTQHDFPVLDEGGNYTGMLSRSVLIGALAEHGPQHPVGSVMETCDTSIDPKFPLPDALDKLRSSSCAALPVLDPPTGRLLGLLTMENIAEMIMVRLALAK